MAEVRIAVYHHFPFSVGDKLIACTRFRLRDIAVPPSGREVHHQKMPLQHGDPELQFSPKGETKNAVRRLTSLAPSASQRSLRDLRLNPFESRTGSLLPPLSLDPGPMSAGGSSPYPAPPDRNPSSRGCCAVPSRRARSRSVSAGFRGATPTSRTRSIMITTTTTSSILSLTRKRSEQPRSSWRPLRPRYRTQPFRAVSSSALSIRNRNPELSRLDHLLAA